MLQPQCHGITVSIGVSMTEYEKEEYNYESEQAANNDNKTFGKLMHLILLNMSLVC